MGLSGTEYYGVAQEGLKLYESTGDPVAFDLAIDRFTLEGIVDVVLKGDEDRRSYAGRLALTMVDEYNLGLALRHASVGLQPAQAAGLLLARGGLYLEPDSLRRLMSEAAPPSAYAELIRRTPYGRHLRGEDVDSILESIALFRLHAADAAWATAPMECAVLVALIFLVENEVRNLSAVAFGIENRVPRDRLYELLRLPD
jgi:vacuolar-type H+-ATPase subunit C/Vma6